MGVRSCEWFLVRDGITIFAWFVAAVSVLRLVILDNQSRDTDAPWDNQSRDTDSPWVRGCMYVCLYLALVAFSCIWEVVLALVVISGPFLELRKRWIADYEPIPTKKSDVASVRLER
jgi:hypothetical protein